MERYNVLYMEDEFPGLSIIQTGAYVGLIQARPGLKHQNWGDFYSSISLENFAEATYNALENSLFSVSGKKLNSDLVIIESSVFNNTNADVSKDYLIKEASGIRLYSPSLHLENAKYEFIEAMYGIVAIGFLEELFCDDLEGSIQAECKESVKSINEILEQINLEKLKKS